MMRPCVLMRLGRLENRPRRGFGLGASTGYGEVVGSAATPLSDISFAVSGPRMKHDGSRFSRFARGTGCELGGRLSGSTMMQASLIREHDVTTSFWLLHT